MGSLASWSPSSAAAAARLSLAMGVTAVEREDEEESMFMTPSMSHQPLLQHTPPSLSHESRRLKQPIKASSQPVPRASPLSVLDFRPLCCTEGRVIAV